MWSSTSWAKSLSGVIINTSNPSDNLEPTDYHILGNTEFSLLIDDKIFHIDPNINDLSQLKFLLSTHQFSQKDFYGIYPKLKESDPNNIVPTSSTSFVMLLCDCLATTIMAERKFTKENFSLYHKGGNLGESLRLAKDIMVSGKKMPIIDSKKSFNQALTVMNKKKLGIVVIVKNKFIKGLITDGDLRRFLNKPSKERSLDKIIRSYPFVINENMSASKALAIMNEKKITSLLVVSDNDYKKSNKILKGIIHIHFLLKNEAQ